MEEIKVICCEWCEDIVDYDTQYANEMYFCNANCARAYTTHYEFVDYNDMEAAWA